MFGDFLITQLFPSWSVESVEIKMEAKKMLGRSWQGTQLTLKIVQCMCSILTSL